MKRALLMVVFAYLVAPVLGAQNTDVLWEKFDSAGWQAYREGELSAASQILSQAVREARGFGDADARLGQSLARLAWVELVRENPTVAGRHAEEAFPIAQRLTGRSAIEQLPLAQIQFVRASVAHRNSRADDALQYYRQAESIFRRVARDESLADTHLEMARILERQGAYLQAFTSARQAADIYTPDGRPEKYLQARYAAARLALSTGRYDEADSRFRALAPQFEASDKDSSAASRISVRERARFWSDYAANDFQLGNWDQALKRCQHARNTLLQVVSDNDPELAPIVDGQARVLTAQGRLDSALALVEWELLAVNEAGVVRARAFATRGDIRFAAGHYAEASSDYEAARTMNQNALGANHPLVAINMSRAARSYAALGRYEEAEKLSKQALRIQDRMLGPGHPAAAVGWEALAEVQLRNGAAQAAASFSQQALDIQSFLPDSSRWRTLPALRQLGLAHWASGQFDEAERSAAQTLEIQQQADGPPDAWLALYFDLSARLRHADNEYGAALNQFERSLNAWSRCSQGRETVSNVQTHPGAAETLLGMVAVHVGLKDEGLAEGRWQEAHRLLSQMYSRDEIANQLERLANIYARQKKNLEAAWFAEKSAALSGGAKPAIAAPANDNATGARRPPAVRQTSSADPSR